MSMLECLKIGDQISIGDKLVSVVEIGYGKLTILNNEQKFEEILFFGVLDSPSY